MVITVKSDMVRVGDIGLGECFSVHYDNGDVIYMRGPLKIGTECTCTRMSDGTFKSFDLEDSVAKVNAELIVKR